MLQHQFQMIQVVRHLYLDVKQMVLAVWHHHLIALISKLKLNVYKILTYNHAYGIIMLVLNIINVKIYH
jgi:hypothetical protein